MAAAKKKGLRARGAPASTFPAPAGIDYSADLNSGLETADRDAFAIPFLRVLQKNSPEVDESSGRAIEGARPGMLFNTVTGEMFDGKAEGCLFIQSAYQRRFIKWAPRGEGRGFLGELTPDAVDAMLESEEVVEHNGRLYVPLDDGTVDTDKCVRISDTRNHFGVVIGKDGVPCSVLLSLTSTQIKKSKLLMSIFAQQKIPGQGGQLLTPPTFAHVIRCTTIPESNDQGSWFGIRFSLEGRVEDPELYQTARAFHATVASGEARVRYEDADPGAPGGEPADDGGKF